MNIIDIMILVVLGVSVIFGMHRGFISGVLSLAAGKPDACGYADVLYGCGQQNQQP